MSEDIPPPRDNGRAVPPGLAMAHQQAARALETHRTLLAYLKPVLPVEHEHAAYAPCEVRRKRFAKGTVFAFAGMAHRFAMSQREFAGVLGNARVNTIFIKDFRQCWYARGLLRITTNRPDTARFLQRRFGEMPRPWLFLGSSSGGHAALFFGARLGADRVVAFGPQSYLDPEVLRRHHPAGIPDPGLDYSDPEHDLQKALAEDNRAKEMHVHFGARNDWDKMHAERLAGIANLKLMEVDTDAHAAARALREDGKLLDALFGGLI